MNHLKLSDDTMTSAEYAELAALIDFTELREIGTVLLLIYVRRIIRLSCEKKSAFFAKDA